MSAVCKLLSLVLVMPAINAVSERSFSCLCRLKSYLRATRLNNVMVLHVHKNLTDKLSLVDIGNNFISASEITNHHNSIPGRGRGTDQGESCHYNMKTDHGLMMANSPNSS